MSEEQGKGRVERGYAEVVRDFDVGHTKEPSRFVGFAITTHANDGSQKKTVRYVMEPAAATTFIQMLQQALQKVAQ